MLSPEAFVSELEPVVADLLHRHLAKSKEWFPHEVVPWSRGRDFERGEAWTSEDSDVELSAELRSALFVNLLTEDNLPYYFRTIERTFGPDGAWGEWNRRWTAEEGRHSIAIRDYLTVTRAIDPVALERARMAQVSCGQVPEPQSPQDGIAYVAMQELATRIAHHNTGKLIDDPAGYEVLKRVAADENHHYLFYRDLVTAALQVDPSGMVTAIERQVKDFEMPGTGIVDFVAHAKAIAAAGIYDFQIHHDKILQDVVVLHWDLPNVDGLDEPAKVAQAGALKHIERVGIAAKRLSRRRDAEPALA
jgi:acyl-[acyl-carrier-protein] desaturase